MLVFRTRSKLSAMGLPLIRRCLLSFIAGMLTNAEGAGSTFTKSQPHHPPNVSDAAGLDRAHSACSGTGTFFAILGGTIGSGFKQPSSLAITPDGERLICGDVGDLTLRVIHLPPEVASGAKRESLLT